MDSKTHTTQSSGRNSNDVVTDKGYAMRHNEVALEEQTVHDAAEHGHAATDSNGHAVVHFDPAAEARLRRKIDIFVIPTVAVIYLFCFIDRTNIGNAKLAGLEKDLGMKGLDYNALIAIFYVAYILFEPPSVLLCKKIGPGWFLPTTTLLFGIMSFCTAFVTNFSNAAGCRFLLGIFEAGMMPCCAYYLSRWYRQAELTFRLSLYVVFAPLAGAFGGLFAGAILKLPEFGPFHDWRMLFAVEGIITIGIAVISFFTLTDRPETARWLSAEEKELATARIKSERVGVTEVLDKMDIRKLISGIANPVTLMTTAIYMLDNVTVQSLSFFAPTIVKGIYPDYSVVQQQIRTAPPYLVGAAMTLLVPFISFKTKRRVIYWIPLGSLIVIGYIMFLATDQKSVRYGAMFLMAGGSFAFGVFSNAHVSANTISDTARSTAIATVIFGGHIGGFSSSWTYTPKDGPHYPIGTGLNLATSSTLTILSVVLFFWMKKDNKKREKADSEQVLSGMSLKQIHDLDWRHPAFRWQM